MNIVAQAVKKVLRALAVMCDVVITIKITMTYMR